MKLKLNILRLKKLFVIAVLAITASNVFAFQVGDYILISRTVDNTTHYLSAKSGSTSVTDITSSPTMYSVWKVAAKVTHSSTTYYRFQNVMTKYYLSIDGDKKLYTKSSANDYSDWRFANSISNSVCTSTMRSYKESDYYINYYIPRWGSSSGSWATQKDDDYSPQSLTFTVLEPTERAYYKDLTRVEPVQERTQISLSCSSSGLIEFTSKFQVTQVAEKLLITGNDTIVLDNETESVDLTTLSELEAAGFVITNTFNEEAFGNGETKGDEYLTMRAQKGTSSWTFESEDYDVYIPDLTNRVYTIESTITAPEATEGTTTLSAVMEITLLAHSRTEEPTDARLEVAANPTEVRFEVEADLTQSVLLQGKVIYSYPVFYNGEMVESCTSYVKEDHPITIQDIAVLDQDGIQVEWCQATVAEGSTNIILTTTQANPYDDARYATLQVLTQTTYDSQDLSIISRVPVAQAGRVPETGKVFRHQLGYSNKEFDSNGMQKTHIYETTLYMIPDGTVKLQPKEAAFNGWQRWYDYRTEYSVGARGETTWATAPANCTTLPSTDAAGTQTRGVYKTGSTLATPILNTPATYAATAHDIACDVSTYTDYTITDTEIIEPTLSCRMIFHLLPASAMVEKMEATLGTQNAVEEYEVVVPAGVAILLPTTYRYRSSSNDTETTLKCYIYNDNGTYKRVGGSSSATASWKVLSNGSYSNITNAIGSDSNYGLNLATTAGTAGQTKVFVLRSSNNYNLVKYTVHFMSKDVVGPKVEDSKGKAIITADEIASRYNVLAMLDFNFDKPGTTAYTLYDQPLDWSESTAGFVYPSANSGYPDNSRATTSGSTASKPWPMYGEYSLVNGFSGMSQNWLDNSITQRGGAANGYMIYMDGTEVPGKICSLQTDAYLCDGEKIYCSAWICNVHKASGHTLPQFKFVIEARKVTETTWHEVSQYMSGELPYTGKWAQIKFEIKLNDQYDEFRIAAYDFATDHTGNDIAIDDICIYSATPPLSAYQASTVCVNKETGTMQVLFRVDYQNESTQEYAGHRIWYDIVNTLGEKMPIGTVQTIDLPTGEQYTTSEDEAFVIFPEMNVEPAEEKQYASLTAFLEANAEAASAHGFIMEESGDADRWVMYVLHNVAMPSDTYTMRMVMENGYGLHDTEKSKCAMSNTFTTHDANDITITNALGIETEADDLCANGKYIISSLINEDGVNPRTNEPYHREGTCYADWLIGINQENCSTKTGYTYNQVIDAITYDLRRVDIPVGETENVNGNLYAKSFKEIDSTYLTKASDYGLIVDLINKGYLSLYQQSVEVYMPAGSAPRSYTIFPIATTGIYLDNKGEEMPLCTDPNVFTLSVMDDVDEIVTLATTPLSDKPEHLRAEIPNIRCSEETALTTLAMPIQALENLVFQNEFTITASSDPDFNPEQHWFGYTPDRLYDLSDGATNPNYYKQGDILRMTAMLEDQCPEGKTYYAPKQGYTYTIELPMQSPIGETTVTYLNKSCPIGSTYVNLLIVPDHVIWSPGTSNDNNWSSDDNWVIADADGNPIEGGPRGFVPMAHTDVIIHDAGDNSSYPVLTKYTLQDVVNMYRENPTSVDGMDIYYDQYYTPNSCKNIRFEKNGMLLNQDYLNYNMAFVDMVIPSAEWTVVAPSMVGVVSGDMYVNAGDNDSAPFEVPTYKGKRDPLDYAFWMSLYNRQTRHHSEIEKYNYEIANAGWGALSNDVKEQFIVGSGVAILGYPPIDKEDEITELNVRLPKQETSYSYFNDKGQASSIVSAETITRPENYGKLAFETDDDRNMQITLQNQFKESNLFVFGNPTMAYIDMYQFLNENDLPIKFYYFDQSTWNVVSRLDVPDPDEIERADFSENEWYLPPMRAVLITTSEPASSLDVVVSADMLAVQGSDKKANEETRKIAMLRRATTANASFVANAENTTKINIYATNEYGSSHLVIGESDFASNAFVEEEDIELLTTNLDGEYDYQAQDLPITPTNIYTVVEDKALSVDVVRNLTTIPLMFTVDNHYRTNQIELIFSGIDRFAVPIYLVDSKTNKKTLLEEGIIVNIEIPENGEARYYLNLETGDDGPGTNIENIADKNDNVYFLSHQVGKVTIVADNTIKSVVAYDLSGRMICSSSNVNNKLCTIDVPQGIMLVQVQTVNDTVTGKVVVK